LPPGPATSSSVARGNTFPPVPRAGRTARDAPRAGRRPSRAMVAREGIPGRGEGKEHAKH
jgi:hypothetical protein